MFLGESWNDWIEVPCVELEHPRFPVVPGELGVQLSFLDSVSDCILEDGKREVFLNSSVNSE